MDADRPKNYLIDMDGVLVRGQAPIPGAVDFLAQLVERQARFLILTNNSIYTPSDLQLRLQRHARVGRQHRDAVAPPHGQVGEHPMYSYKSLEAAYQPSFTN